MSLVCSAASMNEDVVKPEGIQICTVPDLGNKAAVLCEFSELKSENPGDHMEILEKQKEKKKENQMATVLLFGFVRKMHPLSWSHPRPLPRKSRNSQGYQPRGYSGRQVRVLTSQVWTSIGPM